MAGRCRVRTDTETDIRMYRAQGTDTRRNGTHMSSFLSHTTFPIVSHNTRCCVQQGGGSQPFPRMQQHGLQHIYIYIDEVYMDGSVCRVCVCVYYTTRTKYEVRIHVKRPPPRHARTRWGVGPGRRRPHANGSVPVVSGDDVVAFSRAAEPLAGPIVAFSVGSCRRPSLIETPPPTRYPRIYFVRMVYTRGFDVVAPHLPCLLVLVLAWHAHPLSSVLQSHQSRKSARAGTSHGLHRLVR